MAQKTTRSRKDFQTIRNRNNDLKQKNTAEYIKASAANDSATINILDAEYADLLEIDNKIATAELEFLKSNLAQSDAERAVMDRRIEAGALVKAVTTLQTLLTSAAKMADILNRLIRVLKGL